MSEKPQDEQLSGKVVCATWPVTPHLLDGHPCSDPRIAALPHGMCERDLNEDCAAPDGDTSLCLDVDCPLRPAQPQAPAPSLDARRLSEEQLSELDGLERGATPALWVSEDGEIPGVLTMEGNGACGDPECCGSYEERMQIKDGDLALVCAARNALPSLLAEVRSRRSLPAPTAPKEPQR